jgi:hypothetical protein
MVHFGTVMQMSIHTDLHLAEATTFVAAPCFLETGHDEVRSWKLPALAGGYAG